MRAFLKHFGEESARRAWIGVGAPILVLVMVIIALAIGTFANFARQQDEAFVANSTRLAASMVRGRVRALTSLVVDFANWDAAVDNTTEQWNGRWVDENIYSSVANAMFVFRANGVVRHAWFDENVAGDNSELERAAVDAAISIPTLRRLARAATPGQTAAFTYAVAGGRWLIVAVAPVTREDDVVRRNQTHRDGFDYIAAVDLIDPEQIAAAANALDLQDVTFLPAAVAAAAARDEIRLPLLSASGVAIGALQWRHVFPGAIAFQRQIGAVVLVLFAIGLLTILVARHLVSRQIEASSSAKAALESSMEKSELLARVSNELRTPLNAVIGYAELIQEEGSHAVGKDAQRIIDAARQLGVMVNDIIDQSRIDAGQLSLKPVVVPVGGMLAEIQGLMHPVAQAAGVDIVVSQEPIAGYAYADHARLRQCLLNIVGNAVKFSPRGASVRLRARLGCAADSDMIVLEVRDTGIGIRSDEMPAIFRPFGQANGAIAAVYGGAGLGLSIARALARDMGGDISLVSAPGEGSTFYLRVPAATARALSAA